MIRKRIEIFSTILLLSVIFTFLQCTEKNRDTSDAEIAQILQKANTLEQKSPEYLQLADSAYKLAVKFNNVGLIENSLNKIGNHYFENTDYNTAIEKYLLSINFHGKREPDSIFAENYNYLGRIYFRIKNDSLAIRNFKSAAKIRMAIQDSVGYGTSMNNTGYVFWRSSRFDSAIVYFEKALAVREKLPDKENLNSTLNNLGTIYFNWSLYDKALDYYTRSMKLVKELKDVGGEAMILCNIGLVYEKTDQILSAREYYKEAYAKASSIQDSQRVGYALTNLGSTFLKTNIDSAINYYDRSYGIYKKVKFTGGSLLALEGKAKAFLNLDSLDRAEEYFDEIASVSKKENILIRYAIALHYLGVISQKRGNYKNAISQFLESTEISKNINIKFVLVDNYKNLGELYELTGNTQKALAAVKEYAKIKNEIENEDMNRRLTESKKQFEVEKINRLVDAANYENEKQKIVLIFTYSAIVVLLIMLGFLYYLHLKRTKALKLLSETNNRVVAQSEELALANNELLELTKTKDKFYSIVAHDLKNPFITLYGYTEILKNEFFELSDDEKIEYINELESVTKKTYSLLENLLELSSLRMGKLEINRTVFNLKRRVENIVEIVRIQAKTKGIKISGNFEADISVYASESMIDTVIRNLLTNAVKFSHPGGIITVVATLPGDGTALVSVEDNGIGMKSETVANLFNIHSTISSRGTNDEKGTGLGLEICREFVEKNGGKIWVNSEYGNGSTFYFTLPLSK